MQVTAYIDETGMHAPTYTEVLDWYKSQWRAIWGEDLYLESDSQEGQALAIFAQALYDSNQMAVAVYQSLSPQTAIGVGLSQSVKINGLRRKAASRSSVDLRIVGSIGTIISNGVVTDVSGNKWELPGTVVIPATGEILVTALSQVSGPIVAQANEVNKIYTPTRGWQSVNNAAASTPGEELESDAKLRLRQSISTSLPALSIFEASIASIALISGVTKVKGYENDSDVTDSNGIPAHSVCFCVVGGDANTIATSIINKKCPGTGLYGNTTVNVTTLTGNLVACKFTRPPEVTINVTMNLTVNREFNANVIAAIETAVSDFIATYDIGQDVVQNEFFCPVYSTSSTFTITDLKINGAYSTIEIPYNQKAVAGTITVNINS
jgi:uncharacterized phage protein gp47/JayE